MTLTELKEYLTDPARDGSPAIIAARSLLAEYERVVEFLEKRVSKEPPPGVLKAQVRELTGDVESYRKENERLRALLAPKTRAPWEDQSDA